MAPVAKHHTLPAALIGAFSLAPANRLRDSMVWVARREGRPFTQKAENLSWRDDFYVVVERFYVGETPPSAVIDEMWSAAEAALPRVTAALATAARTGIVDAREWLRAADFFAQLFVRNPGYDKRQIDGFAEFGHEISRDKINGSRTLNLQRLRPAVMFARWTILTAPAGSLVTNDCSYMPIHNLHTDETGYVFPLRHNLAVQLMAGPENKEFVQTADSVGLQLPTVELNAEGAASFNLSMAANALDEIYGATEETVANAQTGLRTDVEIMDASFIVPSPHFLRDNEYLYFELMERLGMELPPGSFMFLRANPPEAERGRFAALRARLRALPLRRQVGP